MRRATCGCILCFCVLSYLGAIFSEKSVIDADPRVEMFLELDSGHDGVCASGLLIFIAFVFVLHLI